MENQQVALTLPGPIQLLKDSWLIYKLRFKTLFGILLIYFVQCMFAFIAIVLVGAIGLAFIFATKFSIPVLITVGLVVIPLILLFVFVQNWTIFSLIMAIVHYRERIGIVESFKQGFKKTIPYMWVYTIGNLISGVGFIFFIIPAIIFFVWFFNIAFILAAENIGGFNALLKSKEYVKGYFFSTLLRVIVLFVIVILLQLGISFFPKLISFLQIPYLDIIIPATISIAFAPLGFIYSFLIYDNLRAIKGDFIFQPSRKLKIFFIILLFIPVILISFVIIFLYSTVFSNFRQLPARQFSQANDTKRSSDVNAILNAVSQYAEDNNGRLPLGIDSTVRPITNWASGADICALLVPQYINSLPVDPLTGRTSIIDCSASYNTNYTIVRSATNNTLTVSAPAAELSNITASRRISPSPATLSTFISPDETWILQYNPNRTSPPPAGSTDNFVFKNLDNDCPLDLNIYIVANPDSTPLADYIATNSAYFGTRQGEIVINGILSIKTATTVSPLRVFYSIDNHQRFIILSYPWFVPAPGSSDEYPDPCIESEEYVESLISSFRIGDGVIN